MTKITDEIKDLFQRVRVELGAPIRTVQLTDEQLCSLLEICISDYAEKIQNWLIENQWSNLYGKNLTTTDMAYAMSVRSFDLAQDYSYYFSKEVGLQQRGPWELKKDFIELEPGVDNKCNKRVPFGPAVILYTKSLFNNLCLYVISVAK